MAQTLRDLLSQIRAADPDGSVYADHAGRILALVPPHLRCSPDQERRAAASEVQSVASDGDEDLLWIGTEADPWAIRPVPGA